MNKTLSDRLTAVKTVLGKINGALAGHPEKLAQDVETQFEAIAAFASHVEHWNHLLDARDTARALLADLEKQADDNDNVRYGILKARFQTARLLGVQSYLAAQWSLADRLVAMAGTVLCIRNTLQDPKNQPQLVSHFVSGKGPESRTAAIVYDSLRHSFGWPIAVSYALRNHFLHDGAGGDFFDGPTAASAFKISVDGWKRVEERARSYTVNAAHSRLGSTWGPSAGDDLRTILDTCAIEIDETLGVLVGSACQMALVHLGFMLGED
ncbi:MAG: hypothetical protein FWD69_16785 [Polyangiaceae bacterium]|nr:hypothetical protein [Polyangiaceae bacterium]